MGDNIWVQITLLPIPLLYTQLISHFTTRYNSNHIISNSHTKGKSMLALQNASSHSKWAAAFGFQLPIPMQFWDGPPFTSSRLSGSSGYQLVNGSESLHLCSEAHSQFPSSASSVAPSQIRLTPIL